MLFVVSGVFLVSTLLQLLFSLNWTDNDGTQQELHDGGQFEPKKLAQEIIEFLYPLPFLLNNCGNFPVLFITMEVFRTNVLKMLGFKK